MESDRGSRGDCRSLRSAEAMSAVTSREKGGTRGMKSRRNLKQRYIPDRTSNVDIVWCKSVGRKKVEVGAYDGFT